MPAGTWNLGRLRKRADYVGLKDLGISLIDRTVSSDNYFNITEFPNQLTGGKNLFKLKASANTLVKDSKIHIEVLDSNGNPLYYEPINYIEADGTRVIAIYVYPDAPYGTATVYVAGRARVDLEGRQLRSSKNVNDPDYINFPNVIWSRTVTVAPERLNSTEIIFTQQPSVTLQEVVQPYLQPVNLSNVATQSFGVGTCTIKPKPSSTVTVNTTSTGLAQLTPAAVQGGGTTRTPPSYYGTPIAANPGSLQMAENRPDLGTTGLTSGTTTTIITALDESIFETSEPFFTSDMGQGDVITVVNPNIEPPGIGARLNSNGELLPDSQAATEGHASAAPGLAFPLSGSYYFVIDRVLDTKRAHVALLGQPAGFKNIQDSNTGGKFSVTLTAGGGRSGARTQTVDEVKATANYTCSFTLPYVVNITEQSQSFAEIKISNIEPATGDVYKLKTFYKAGGQFGDFVDAGETILEQVEILEDSANFEANAQDGAQYNRMGFFSSLTDYQTYFTSSQGVIAPSVQLTETFEPDDLMSGIRLTPASNYGPDDFGYIRLKDEYRPELTKDTQYLMTVNLFADNSFSSTDPNVSNLPQLDIYVRNISGSTGKFNNDENTVNAYIKNPFANDYENSLTGIFDSDATFGVRIGSVQVPDSGSIVPAIFRFESLDAQKVEFYFVQRNGRFNIGNISVKTFNESKFTPNFTRINTRIPTQFIKTPLTFKLLFYDYLNQQAEAEAIIYPVTFTGENTVHEGDNNIITGTMTVGNTVGAGIELVGQNSAYIRAIGYEGFNKAIKPENPGGFLMYTGSIQITGSDGLGDTDNYQGVGLELVEHSESFLRFATDTVSGLAPGLEIRTPKFFLGSREAGNFISGSNGNIEITSSNFHLDRDGDVILQGTITANAGGSIGGFLIQSSSLSTTAFALSSSQNTNDPVSFISSSNFKVSAGGTITGSSVLLGSKAGGNFLEFVDDTLTVQGTITADNIRTPSSIGGSPSTEANASSSINSDGFAKFASASIAGFEVIDSEIKSTSEQLRLKSSGQITGSNVLFTGGDIAGWQITSNTIKKVDSTGGIQFHSTNRNITIRTGSLADTNVLKIGNLGSNKYGIQGLDSSGNEIFKLGEDGNEIAGWTIDNEKLQGGSMIIRKDGTIESDGFASNVAGSGFRLTANDGGFLEVENARIRGTLSTATFEKETVNAVGGQLYVANSTVLTGSAIAPEGIHSASMATMSVVNVTGFSAGEILTAKKVSSTGFATEYMLVDSSSRTNPTSETDLSGLLFVQRGYSGSAGSSHDSGSLGDIASNAQSYSGSQVIVSTGKIGTGYIRLNANPNDPTTPYIDIVERTGSAIYDIDLKARLGDLSGITDSSFSDDVTGFGLYTSNGYFKGKLEVAAPDGKFQHRIFVRGGDFSNSGDFPAFVSFGNAFTASRATAGNRPTRGHNLYIVSESVNNVLELRHFQAFDTNLDINDGNTLAGILTGTEYATGKSLEQDDLIVVLTHDASKINQTLYGALTASGATNPRAFNSDQVVQSIPTSGTNRAPYAFVGQRGIGRGNGFEAVGLYDGANTTSGSAVIEAFYTRGRISANTINTGTQISGDRLRTGVIQSNNFAAALGSELNLDLGTIKLGGSANPLFSVDASGHVSASAGSIAGLHISTDSISRPGVFEISSSQDITDPVSFISSSAFKVSADGRITASAGDIGGFEIGSTKIQSATDQNSNGTDDTFVTMGSVMNTTTSSFNNPLGFSIYRLDSISPIGETKIIRMGQIAPKDRGYLSGSTELGFTVQKRVKTGGDELSAYKDIVRFGQDETFIGGEVRIGGMPEIVFFEDFSSSTTAEDYFGSDSPNTNGSDKTFFRHQNNGNVVILQNQSDTVEGTNALQVGDNSSNDEIWASNNFLIPYDGVSLYEYEIRIKQTLPQGSPAFTGSNTGTDSFGFYAGYTGYNADATTKENYQGSDSFSSQHYTAAANKPLKVDYQTFKGYLKGNSAGDADASNKRFKSQPGTAQADVAFVAPMFLVNYQNDSGTVMIDYIKVTKYESGGLRVGAGGITTGLLQSFNLNADSGSQIDMDNGTIKLGGVDSPGFSVDEQGFVKATNFAEKVVAVDTSNRTQYFEDIGSGGVRLVFDGSLGGEVTMNMQLDTPPHNFSANATKPIQDIKLPQQASDDYSSVRVIVGADGVQFDNGTINESMAQSTFTPAPPP